MTHQLSRKPLFPPKTDPAASSSIETLVSTVSTIPYAQDDGLNDNVRSIPSTIDLVSEPDVDNVQLCSHYVPPHRQRPPAPFTVISETRLGDEADSHPDEIVIGDDVAEININNSEDIRIINDAEINADEIHVNIQSDVNSVEVVAGSSQTGEFLADVVIEHG